MAAPLCFIDLETISLQPKWEHIWEIGAIVVRDGHTTEHQWFVKVDLAEADPYALNVGRYHQRHPDGYDYQTPVGTERPDVLTAAASAVRVAKLTLGCHLVGAVVSFDEKRLEHLLRAHGHCPGWHYHLIDVEALAAGWLAGSFSACQSVGDPDADGPSADDAKQAEPPWDSNELSRAVGVDPDDFDRHTALGDCLWSEALYEAVMGG